MTKILLVEDDKSLREIYAVRLMAEGYEIVSAGDGEEALAMAIKEKPNLILSDVMMPKISGFDMLDILRSTTETKNVKVIMMTALSSEDQRARGESLGADRYLVKSQVGIEDVVRTVHDVLGDGVQSAAPEPSPFATPSAKPAAPANPAPPTDTPPPAATAAPAPAPAPTPSQPSPPVSPPPVTPTPAPSTPTPPPAPPSPTTPPVINTPPVAPTPPPASPAPAAPESSPTTSALPQPTAPFSSPAPASLGDKIIQPIDPTVGQPPADIAAQMNAELNNATPAPAAPPPPPQPPVAPNPPAPTPATSQPPQA